MAKSSGGKRKLKRNSVSCNAYRMEGRREKNKVRRLRKHLRNHRTDVSAVASIKRVGERLGMKPSTFHDLQGVVL